jgi:CubicO group peptidase (beta-lactamase class C family)
MYTPQFPIDGQVGGYGLGIASEPLHRGTLLQHGGGGYGYLTAQMWTPEYQVGVVVLTNSTSGDPYGIAKYVLQAMIRVKYGPLPQTEPGKPTDRPIITLDIKSLQRLAGTYKPRGSVVTFKVKEDGLYRVSGTPDVKLNPHSPTEFTTGGGKYTFTLDEKGRPKGVQVLTPSYVDFMPFNDSPYEEAGPNKKEWQDFVGEYSCTVCGGTNTDSVMIKNGYLYLRDGGGLKLFEYKPGFFFTADGEAVIFQGDRMLLSNTPYLKKSTKTSLDVPQSTVIQPADKQDARQKPTIGQHDRNLSGKMPTVDQILDKYVQAMGGTEAIRKLKTRVLKGTIEFVKREVTIVGDSEIYAASPNKRMEITRIKVGSCYEEDVLEGFNGTVGWSNSDRFRKLEGAELAVKKREAEFYREIKLKELYPRMILNGTEKIGDRLAYVLNATPAEGDPEKMYFDIETGLLVRIDMEKYFAKYLRVPFQMFLDDYREIDGVKQPFTFRYISPELKIIYRFNEIKHNTVIEDAKINLPGSALTSLPDLTTDERVQLSSLIAPTTDEYIQMEMKRRCIPGLAVVVIKKGEVVKMKGFGLASLDHSVPVTPDTVFDLASVTKQITATAIMTLVDQGKIKLDDPIVQYLPDSPSQWSGITIRHLLTNTAGLRVRYFVNPRYSTANNFKFLSEEPLRSNPGSEYFYSSAGFFLLGMIIEKVSGIRYKDFLAELFFKPLGMNSTSVLGNREIVNNRATCYTIRDGKLANRECYALDDELPASYGVLSTVRDLAKWDIALAAGKLVKEPSLATMWTPVKLNDGSTYPYGFGWEIEKFFGRRMITHSGAAGTEYTFLPDDRLTVIVLTNLGVGEVNSWGLTKGVAIRYLSGLP